MIFDLRKTLAGTIVAAAAMLLTQPASASDQAVDYRKPLVVNQQAVDLEKKAEGALVFEKSSIDFGKVDEGEVVPIDFPVTNTSDKTIQIKEIKTGCGCTAKSDTNPTKLGPGESSTIGVVYKTQGRRGTASRTISIYTDEETQSVYRVSFSGYVTTPLYYEKSVLDFGDIDAGSESTQQVKLFCNIPEGVDITNTRATNSEITAEVIDSERVNTGDFNGYEYTLEVTIPASTKVGPFAERLMIETNSEKGKLNPLILRGKIVGELEYSPNRLYSSVSFEQEVKRTITLSSRKEVPFEVTRVETDRDIPIEYEIKDGSNEFNKIITATMKAGKERRTYQGNTVVYFKSGDKEEESSLSISTIMVVRPERQVIRRPANADSEARLTKPGADPS